MNGKTIISAIDDKSNNLKTKIILRKVKSALDDCDVIANLTLSSRRPLSYKNQSIDLVCKSMVWFLYNIGTSVKEIHSNSVFVLIDKAGNNVAIKYKRLYSSVIAKKLGFNSGSNNDENGTDDKTNSIMGNYINNEHKEYLPKHHGNRLTEPAIQRCFLKKDVLKICSKFTREHPCRSVISINLLWHMCSPENLLHIFRTLFLKNTSGRLLLNLRAK